ncbi:MAG: hypothetical protein PHS79_06100, partial [Patescibacteria group bacterium]|nr:hypothetical protein [Patescibacteria group bacterium]
MQTDNQNRSVKNGWGEKLKLGLRNTLSNVGVFVLRLANICSSNSLNIEYRAESTFSEAEIQRSGNSAKRKFMRRVVCAGMLALAIVGTWYVVRGTSYANAAGIAHTVNYQGRLLTTGGTSVPDGTYQMEFRLYTAASGGSHLWSASTTDATPTGSVAAIDITVTNGLFSVLLGDEGNGQVAFPEDIFNNDGLYLGVTIGADSEMTPRKRLSAVPYAYNSETLQGQYASHTVANTGGSLFALNLGSTDAAVANRSAFYVHTSGTSNVYDFLMRADSGSSLFSITRQGNVTTTGNLQVDGHTILGNATSDMLTVNARVSSDLTPAADVTYNLGLPALRWKSLYAANVSSTNIEASGYVSTTQLFINGTMVTGIETQDLQDVTDLGAITTNWIQFAGATSTSNFLPGTNNLYNLGSTAYAWKKLFS